MAEQPASAPKSPRRHKPFTLQKKFLLGVGVIFLGFCLVIAFLIYYRERKLLVEAAHRKAEMVLAAAEANRNYVREVLRPKMYDLVGQDGFVLEAMSSSYVSRGVMERFRRTLPSYQYRRVALNARNPHSVPKPVERRLIEYFATHPQKNSWHGLVRVAGQETFINATPVYFVQSCMHCHGDPREAPPALLEKYGRERGFGHRPGEIAGISAVTIPVEVALAAIQSRALTVFGISLVGLSWLFIGISFFFNRVVVHNLRDLLDIFRHGLRNEKELELLSEAQAKDEIGELTSAAQVLVGHLGETRQQLEDYTGNLEQKVAQRTQALKESQQRLEEKVAARNQELHTLNTIAELITQAMNLADILPRVLRQTLRLIPARGAALYLLRDNPSHLELQCQENAGQLIAQVPVDTQECRSLKEGEVTDLTSSFLEAACGRMSFFACAEERNCLNVPLICRGQVMGVMTFVEVDFPEISPERRELLLCVGQQIGITIESLQNVEQLVHSKDLLQSVFDGISDMMVLLDRDLRIKMVNKGYLQHYGLTLEEVLDQPCPPPAEVNGSLLSPGSLQDIFQSRKPRTEEVQSGDGEIFLVHYYPIMDDKGEVASIVGYIKNITTEKGVEQRIQRAEKMAALGQLAGGIAHEINNPLGVILCYADLLKSQLADFPQGLMDVGTIEKHAKNCQRIVADLLKFSRSQETAPQLASLNPTLEEVVRMVDHQFRRQHCRIDLDLDHQLPPLRFDPDKMKQVFLNLLMNARQAGEGRDGLIRISTSLQPEAHQVRIVFWDNGPGIPAEIMGRIFDPFFTTKKTGEGTGLGLAVSYGIIKDHGGDIQVESEPGQWTRFTIMLPLEAQG